MTEKEYNKRMMSINIECEEKKRKLIRDYAKSNNPYKIGDVVEDHIGKLRIESIEFYNDQWWQLPSCVYYGVELKKDGTPCKRQTNRPVYLSNIKK